MELVMEALDMAIWNRKAEPGVIHHSDHGSQYTALAYGQRVREAGLPRRRSRLERSADGGPGGLRGVAAGFAILPLGSPSRCADAPLPIGRFVK
jgi:hypothetical protein